MRRSGLYLRHFSSTKHFLAVRPKIDASVAPEQGTPRRGRLGLLFLLGGACLATWMIKPSTKPPVAAFDPVKRKVCILFLFGTPNSDQIKALSAHGFVHVRLDPDTDPEKTLEPLVQSGKTWLAISNLPTKDLKAFEQNVVQCDLALDFHSNQDLSIFNERLQQVNGENILEILDKKNM